MQHVAHLRFDYGGIWSVPPSVALWWDVEDEKAPTSMCEEDLGEEAGAPGS